MKQDKDEGGIWMESASAVWVMIENFPRKLDAQWKVLQTCKSSKQL